MKINIEEINSETFLGDRVKAAINAAERPLSMTELRRLVKWDYGQLRNQVRTMTNKRKLTPHDVDGDIYYGLPAMEMPEEFEPLSLAA